MIYDYDYFISYAPKDNEDGIIDEFVERLRDNPDFVALFGAKPRIFFDKEAIRGMDDWEYRIRYGIDSSRFLIVFLSPSYFQSEMCAKEFDWWLEHETHSCVLGGGIAPLQLVDVPGLFSGSVSIPQELQNRFPSWVSELRKRQSPVDFDLRERTTAKIVKTINALCRISRDRFWRQNSASKSMNNYAYPNHNKNFVGRREYLRSLRDNLERNNLVALHGLGGVGKTELALMYGRSFAWDYQLGRVYINCENQSSLFSAILGSGLDIMTGVELQGPERDRFTMLIDTLHERRDLIVKENEKNGRYQVLGARLLLILDNVTETNLLKKEDLQRFKQRYDFVHIVVTTRENPSRFAHLCSMPVDSLSDSEALVCSMPVDSLSDSEALELLRVLRPFGDDAERDAACEIVRVFGGHAFRVEKIGAYLRFNKWETYQGFLDKALERFGYLHETIDANDFQLRHEAIRDEGCLRPTLERLSLNAKKLLEWAALFGPDSVPVPWLGELAEIEGDELYVALQDLEDYRLLIPLYAESKEQAPHVSEAKLARLLRIAREIVLDQTSDEFRPSALEQISGKIGELLSKGASYWFAGGVAWGLDSITDFCFERYEGAKRREPSGHDHDLIGWFHELFDLYLDHLRIFDRARRIGKASEELSQRRVKAAPDDSQALHDLSVSYEKLGGLSNAEGDYKKAREYYEKALKIREQLVSKTPDSLQALRDLSVSYEKLGGLSKTEGDHGKAREFFEQHLAKTSEIFSRTPDDPQAFRDLGLSYGSLGDLSRVDGDYKKAREYYKKAWEKCDELVRRIPDDLQALHDLSFCYNNLGSLSSAEGDYKKAREYYEKALKIREQLVSKTPDSLQALRDLSVSYEKLGGLSNTEGDHRKAREYFEQHLLITFEIFHRTPDDPQAFRDLGLSYGSLGDLSRVEGDYKKAREFYEKALEKCDELVKRVPDDLQALRDLSFCYNNLGDLSSAEGDYEKAREHYKKAREYYKKAREYYDKALEIRKQLVSRTRKSLQALHDLSVSYEKLGDLSKVGGDYTEAREYYEKALEIRKRLVSRTPDSLRALCDLGVSRKKLGDLLNAEGVHAHAMKHYEKALEVFKRIDARTPDNLEVLHVLSDTYVSSGNLSYELGIRSQAREYYEKAFEVSSRIVACTPWSPHVDTVSSPKVEGVCAQERKHSERILGIFKKTGLHSPDNLKVLHILSISHDNLGNKLKKAGDCARARKYYKKALKIRKKIALRRPDDVEALRALSVSYNNLNGLSAIESAYSKARKPKKYYEKALEILKETVLRSADKSFGVTYSEHFL